jgi:predicted GTPase
MDAQDMNPTPDFNHGRFKILFANQVSIKPPTFVFSAMIRKPPISPIRAIWRTAFGTLLTSMGTPISIIYRERK